MARLRVLIIVQNLPVPLDRRVWLEAKALTAAGYGVSVICPKGPGDPRYQVLDDIHIYKYAPPPRTRGLPTYVFEFVYCWVRTALLSLKVLVRDGFDVIQACNPPDTYFALARIYRLLGKRFVYDQHDLNPELFLSRFGESHGWLSRLEYRTLLALERMTYRASDHVIATNESYKKAALERGGLEESHITVVRSGPDTSMMRPVDVPEDLRHGKKHLAVYLGIMGPQDGVDLLLRAMRILVHDIGRRDCHLALLGFGDCLEDVKTLAHELDLDDFVTFTGRADARMISRYLSAADLGLAPDPLTKFNDVSTMNKIMEYMAHALTFVSFALTETRVSGGDTGTYVPVDDIEQFAHAVDELLDDVDRRARMAADARRRVVTELDWAPNAKRYVAAYDGIFGVVRIPEQRGWPAQDRRRTQRAAPLTDQWGDRLIDLRDNGEFEAFTRTRRFQPVGVRVAQVPRQQAPHATRELDAADSTGST